MTPKPAQEMTQVEGREKEILSSIIAGYNSDMQALEDENKILKETVSGLRKELEKFQQQGLLKPKKLGRRTMFVKENLDDFAQNCLQESDKSFVQKKIREAGL